MQGGGRGVLSINNQNHQGGQASMEIIEPTGLLVVEGNDTDIRNLNEGVSLVKGIKPVALIPVDRFMSSNKLEHLGSIYGVSAMSGNSTDKKVFMYSKAMIGQALELLDEQVDLEQAANFITGVIVGLEARRDAAGASLVLVRAMDIIVRYLANNKEVQRLIALREDRLFKALQVATFDGVDKSIPGIDWSKIKVEGKGVSVEKHANGEAVGYHNGKVAGIRLIDGRYRIDSGVPKYIKQKLVDSFAVGVGGVGGGARALRD